jgi:hypothetical protein
MKAVYRIGGPKNDSEGASTEPLGYFRVPSLHCNTCGAVSASTDVWYASMRPNSPEAADYSSRQFPENVESYHDYASIKDNVSQLFNTRARLLPGSIIGAKPVDIESRNYTGGLTAKNLKQGVDFISAGFGWVVHERIVELLQRCSVSTPLSPVLFRTAKAEFSGYRVVELEPQAVWTEAEHARYDLTICETCGAIKKRSNRSTFLPKEFRGSVFRDGYVIIRAAESQTFYINEALHEELSKLKPKGVGFDKAGEWA